MDSTKGHPSQTISPLFASRWRRFAGAWPLYVVILGSGAVIWLDRHVVVLDLVGLT